MTRPSSHSSPSPPSCEPRARAQAASPPFAAEATAAAAAAASAASTAVASPRAAERGRGPPLHGVPCGRGIGRIGALRSRTRWPTRWAASRSRSRLGTTRSAGEAGSSRVDAPRTSRPAAASTGAATCRGLLWPSRASRSKRVRLAGRPTHLPSTRSVRGGSSNARAMCDGRWCWRLRQKCAPGGGRNESLAWARACVCLLRTAWRAGASPSRAGGSNSVGGPTEVGATPRPSLSFGVLLATPRTAASTFTAIENTSAFGAHIRYM